MCRAHTHASHRALSHTLTLVHIAGLEQPLCSKERLTLMPDTPQPLGNPIAITTAARPTLTKHACMRACSSLCGTRASFCVTRCA